MKAGWNKRSLSEVCQFINRGISPKYLDEGGIAVLNQKCVRDHEVNIELGRRHDVSAKKVSEDRLLRAGDVLVNSTGTGTLGRVAQLRVAPNEPTTVDSHVTIVRAQDGLFHPEFFGYALISIENEIQAGGEGCGGQTELSRTKLAEGYKIGFPDNLITQRRIVTLLDEAFADIATAKVNAEKNLQNAEALFQSQLTTLFNRRAKNATHTTLGKATGGIFTGPFGSLLHKQDYVENGIPLVNPAHISHNGIEPDYRKTVSGATAKRLANYIMRTGDIVIGRRGEMGRCALVTDAEDGWLCGTGSFFIKPSPRCDAGYLVHLLRSDQYKQQLEKIAGGAVMPNLSNTDLSNFALELPPVEEQKQIVAEIEEAKESVERLKSIYRQKLSALDDLKKSLLHQAFSGQL